MGCVAALLEGGANPLIPDVDGVFPLTHHLRLNQISCAQIIYNRVSYLERKGQIPAKILSSVHESVREYREIQGQRVIVLPRSAKVGAPVLG